MPANLPLGHPAESPEAQLMNQSHASWSAVVRPSAGKEFQDEVVPDFPIATKRVISDRAPVRTGPVARSASGSILFARRIVRALELPLKDDLVKAVLVTALTNSGLMALLISDMQSAYGY